MALSYARGAVVIPFADATTTTYTISGLTFQPKALRFVMHGLIYQTTDFANETNAHWRTSIGFATSTSDRRVICATDLDTQGTTVCAAAWSEQGVGLVVGSASILVRIDLDAINSDGFRLIKDVGTNEGGTILWEAWGGDDITVATTLAIAEPAATGTVDYAVTGFTDEATDQVVMFAGCQSTSAVDTHARNDSGLVAGFASGTGSSNNIVCMANDDDNSGNADTDGYCKTGACLGMITVAGGNPSSNAVLSDWGTNQFTLNWTARATTNRRYIALAIKGGSWTAGSYTINGNSGSATATVSGLTYTPRGVTLMGRMTAEDTAGTATAQARMAFGTGTSTSDRASFGWLSEDGVGTSECNYVGEFDQVLAFPGTSGTTVAAYDINAMNSDGFQIIVDVAGGVASEWQGYLTYGDAPAAGAVNPLPWFARTYRGRRF